MTNTRLALREWITEGSTTDNDAKVAAKVAAIKKKYLDKQNALDDARTKAVDDIEDAQSNLVADDLSERARVTFLKTCRNWDKGLSARTDKIGRMKVRNPATPPVPSEGVTLSQINAWSKAIKLDRFEEAETEMAVQKRLKKLRPQIILGRNKTKVTDSRRSTRTVRGIAEDVMGISRDELFAKLQAKADQTRERKQKASAIALAALQMVNDDFDPIRNRPDGDTPAQDTLKSKPNAEKVREPTKVYNVNFNIDVPTPESMGFGHAPVNKPVDVRQLMNMSAAETLKRHPQSQKQQFPRKPSGDAGSNIESGRGYY